MNPLGQDTILYLKKITSIVSLLAIRVGWKPTLHDVQFLVFNGKIIRLVEHSWKLKIFVETRTKLKLARGGILNGVEGLGQCPQFLIHLYCGKCEIRSVRWGWDSVVTA